MFKKISKSTILLLFATGCTSTSENNNRNRSVLPPADVKPVVAPVSQAKVANAMELIELLNSSEGSFIQGGSADAKVLVEFIEAQKQSTVAAIREHANKMLQIKELLSNPKAKNIDLDSIRSIVFEFLLDVSKDKGGEAAYESLKLDKRAQAEALFAQAVAPSLFGKKSARLGKFLTTVTESNLFTVKSKAIAAEALAKFAVEAEGVDAVSKEHSTEEDGLELPKFSRTTVYTEAFDAICNEEGFRNFVLNKPEIVEAVTTKVQRILSSANIVNAGLKDASKNLKGALSLAKKVVAKAAAKGDSEAESIVEKLALPKKIAAKDAIAVFKEAAQKMGVTPIVDGSGNSASDMKKMSQEEAAFELIKDYKKMKNILLKNTVKSNSANLGAAELASKKAEAFENLKFVKELAAEVVALIDREEFEHVDTANLEAAVSAIPKAYSAGNKSLDEKYEAVLHDAKVLKAEVRKLLINKFNGIYTSK